MPTITFKAKARTMFNADETPAYRFVSVPNLTRSHCDMPAFRQSRRFGGFANSDLFPAMLKRELSARKIGPVIRLDRVPDGVAVNETGFLAVITINVEA